MNVVDMARKVVVASDGVLPVSSLPQGEFAIAMASRSARSRDHVIAEERFDKSPWAGIIGVFGRQRPNGMQMVGSTTIASIENGRCRRARRNAARNAAISSTSADERRSASVNVKK
jgi:hypothetical protein